MKKLLETTFEAECRCAPYRAKAVSINTEIIRALLGASGMLTIDAKRLGISYNTLKEYIGNNPELREAIIEMGKHELDCAEKNSSSVFFYLKCKGKKRGFIESVPYTPPPCHPVTFKYRLVIPDQYRSRDMKLFDPEVVQAKPSLRG